MSEGKDIEEHSTVIRDLPSPVHNTLATSEEKSNLSHQPQASQMEVHHHGHVHEQKKWKEYVFQFFMLFLAVFCGFFAEYQLEHVIENSREKEFIKSLIHNVKEDTIEINVQLKRNRERIKGMDSLVRLARADLSLPENVKTVYLLYLNHVPYSNLFRTNDATMQQLKNAGGLRLVRKGHAADSIVKYDANNKAIVSQEQYYISSVTNAMEASYLVMDQTIFVDTSYYKRPFLTEKTPPPLTNNDEKLRVLFNTVMIHQLITAKYNLLLEQQLEYARTFIPYLHRQYKIGQE
jgi:hypothetical protein